MGPLACFFFSIWFPGKNNNARKILAPWSSERYLKLKNTQNIFFLFCRVITQIRGIDGKSP
jgi:hypothetical protein